MKVLVVDDDPQIRSLLKRGLALEGFEPETVGSAEEAMAQVEGGHEVDLFVVDQMLPGATGLAFVRWLRRRGAGHILMLTAKDAVSDRVLGLEAGADDYLGKPFALEELVARLRALVRRFEEPAGSVLRFEDLAFDLSTLEATRGGRALELTPTERKLLEYFLRHPQQALSRQQILEAVWGYDFGGEDNVLEVYIGYLRKKLEAYGEARLIHTVRGHGYALRRT